MAFVVVFGDVGGYALDGEGAVSDAIGVAADNGAEVCVHCFVVANVVGGVVVAQNYILGAAALVIDEEIG